MRVSSNPVESRTHHLGKLKYFVYFYMLLLHWEFAFAICLPMQAFMFVCLCACPLVCLSSVQIANANVLV